MSNKDKSSQQSMDKGSEQELAQKLEQLFDKESSETTSSSLDASIMQMAQKQLDEKVAAEAPAQSWWQKITGRSFKYPMSIAAALLVTVGIARFMAHLGGVDVGLVQKPELMSATEQAARESIELDFQLEDESRSVAAKAVAPAAKSPEWDDFTPPLIAQEETLKQKKEISQIELKKMREQQKIEDPEGYAKHQELLARVRAGSNIRQSHPISSEEKVVVTGSRIRQEEAEASAPVALKDKSDSLTGADDASYGVLDEAVLGYPLPEVWLEQIEQALADKDEIKALDEWGQFKRTYPDYKVADSLLEKIKSLQNLGKSN